MIQPYTVSEGPMLNSPSQRPTLKDLMDSYERSLIQAALEATAGNQRRAAASLGLLPTTLHEKMKRLGLLRRGRTSDQELAG
jgi:DNA-binding NtrC family response regulator